MGVSASKTQNDEQLVPRVRTGSPHQRRSRRQHQPNSPPGIPSQAQFGYLIQQIGEDPNQVQVTPGYYYAGYEQQSKHRRKTTHRRHNSAPASSHRSHYRSRDSKTTTSQPPPPPPQQQQQHRSSRERRHPSRRSTEPRETRTTRIKERSNIPDLEIVSEEENIRIPSEAIPTKRPVSAKSTSSRHERRRTDPIPDDTEPSRKHRENPLPKPPKEAYESDKHQHLKRSQTVDAITAAGTSSRRDPTLERSTSERRPKPHQPIKPNELTHRKSASVDNRIEKKLPKPPIKDRVLEKLFRDVDNGEPSSSLPNRKGPLSTLRSFTFPNIPLKKTFLNRSESRLYPTSNRRPGTLDQPPPYVGPPVSIPLSSPLNPASPHEVTFKKRAYPTAAHLFEAHKFLKHKPELAERLRMVTESPYEMGKLAYSFQMEGMVREDWELVWRDKLDEVLWLKFAQHPRLREELLATGYSLLLDGNEVRHADPDTPGVNELGKAYMRLRDRLRREEQ
ncbi:hypothetical protein Clacol_001106 [Clathrus columnatus]|uniref:NADAR domain-containing protein n=1 Tax=Clathrus columnatus TaxID=1419009 RepID=A0AAV5A4U0_9AGAM|nr:hypothetical protein Clacol_001106 [Clathrus columnatus]